MSDGQLFLLFLGPVLALVAGLTIYALARRDQARYLRSIGDKSPNQR